VKIAVFLLCFLFYESLWAGDFSTEVKNVSMELVADHYQLNADIIYRISPIAREALQKGVSLTWAVVIKTEEQGVLWNSTIKKLSLSYQIQNHALLNIYSVKHLNSGEKEVFSSLAGALNSMSKIRGLDILDKQRIKPENSYHVAIKAVFKHEALPVPLRPFSYFDSQWALSSSHWTLWPLQN